MEHPTQASPATSTSTSPKLKDISPKPSPSFHFPVSCFGEAWQHQQKKSFLLGSSKKNEIFPRTKISIWVSFEKYIFCIKGTLPYSTLWGGRLWTLSGIPMKNMVNRWSWWGPTDRMTFSSHELQNIHVVIQAKTTAHIPKTEFCMRLMPDRKSHIWDDIFLLKSKYLIWNLFFIIFNYSIHTFCQKVENDMCLQKTRIMV